MTLNCLLLYLTINSRFDGTRWINETVDVGDRFASEAMAGQSVTVNLVTLPNITFNIDQNLDWAGSQRIRFVATNDDGTWIFNAVVDSYTPNTGSITLRSVGVDTNPTGQPNPHH